MVSVQRNCQQYKYKRKLKRKRYGIFFVIIYCCTFKIPAIIFYTLLFPQKDDPFKIKTGGFVDMKTLKTAE